MIPIAYRKVLFVALLVMEPAFAQTMVQPSTPVAIAQPGMNLGDTSFLDAGGSPGLTLELLSSASDASYANNGSGQRLAGKRNQATGVFNIHPLYSTAIKVFGGDLGFDVLVPTAAVGVDIPGHGRVTTEGVGDVSIGTYVEWQGLLLDGEPLSVRTALSVTTPTGGYARDRLVNIGNNAWQVTPYVSVTWQPTTAWEISVRTTFDWVGRNLAPNTGLALHSAQAGDQIGTNLAASYALSRKIQIGLSSFYYQQLRDARSDDVPIAGTRQRLFGVGPGLLWAPNGKSVILANFYRELGAENRVEGCSLRLRLLQTF